MSDTPLSSSGQESTAGRCGPKVAVKLPVIGSPAPTRPVVKSKMGKWRAAVLIAVYVVMGLHLLQWWLSGMSDGVRETLSPVEPSESMFTLEGGRVNAGFVMFALALLSTVVFGRFFCGWACHIVALQDWCGWIMKKLGIHPKPFRSRLLLWAPLLLAIYMFVWPTFRREVLVPAIGHDLNRDGQYSAYIYGLRESQLGRDLNHDGKVSGPRDPEDFVRGVPEEAVGLDLNGNGNATDLLPIANEFPPWLGEVIPLHGFDRHFIIENYWATFASWEVAVPFLFVCGFVIVYFMGAKAFCSYGCPYGGFFAPLDRLAPVRIRVDENCHQCGHCTAVCTSNVRVHEEVNDYGAVVDPGCMKCLDCISVCPNDALSLAWGAPALAARPVADDATVRAHAQKAERRWDLTLGEELVVGLVFLLMLLGYRGMYHLLPLLMTMGVTSVVTFMAFKSWRMLRDRNVRGPFVQLKRDGRVRPAGALFALASAALVAVGLQGLAMNALVFRAEMIDALVSTPSQQVFAKSYAPAPADKEQAEKAVRLLTLAGPISRGGVAFMSTFEQEMRLAWLNSVAGDFKAGEAAIRRALDKREPLPDTIDGLYKFFALRAAPPSEVEQALKDLVARWPDHDVTRSYLAGFYLRQYQRTGDARFVENAKALYQEHLARRPRDVNAIHSAAMLRLQTGRPAEAAEILRNGLALIPKSPLLHERLAQALASSTPPDIAGAVEHLRVAIDRQPSAERWSILAELENALGHTDAAREAQEQARKLGNLTAQQGGAEPPSATR